MANPRYEIIDELKIGIYHCMSRCVRRAFLCGDDHYTGMNYDHRKPWVRDRIKQLQDAFAVDVVGYAVMSNHFHTILRNRPDIVAQLSDTEVAQRWLSLCPRKNTSTGEPDEPNPFDVKELARSSERIEIIRKRLSSISWFMRFLNEFIARKANREDKVTGRFWEGRFKCLRLEDTSALLSCMIYVDLNEVRADATKTPETSTNTGAYERISALKARDILNSIDPPTKRNKFSKLRRESEADSWLCPIDKQEHFDGVLPISLKEYLNILDLTGREIVHKKRGQIDARLPPILYRLHINPKHWLNTCSNFGNLFSRVSGTCQSMKNAAYEAHKHWFKGLSSANTAFLTDHNTHEWISLM